MGAPANTAAIVGVGESERIGYVPDRSAVQLAVEASIAALQEAGLAREEVDAVYSQSGPASRLAAQLGIEPLLGVDTTDIGGASNAVHVARAAAAIAAGQVEAVLIAHGGKNRSNRERTGFLAGRQRGNQWSAPFGMGSAVSEYAIAARRHMHEYGTTSEQLAWVAVATRQWAIMNPRATMRGPITVEDVLNSRMICDPLHLLDCCLVSEAGGAVVVTSLERARDLKQRPIVVLGYGECHRSDSFWKFPDLTRSTAGIAAERAMKMAGVGHSDIQVLELYDAFTNGVIQQLEDIGFCQKGEGGPFVEGGRTGPGGDFPMNTQGGALSYIHPGMFGIWTVIEAVRQLRHDYEGTPRQVQDARVGMAHAQGGTFNYHCNLILGRE